jgi:hypothetical protein
MAYKRCRTTSVDILHKTGHYEPQCGLLNQLWKELLLLQLERGHWGSQTSRRLVCPHAVYEGALLAPRGVVPPSMYPGLASRDL